MISTRFLRKLLCAALGLTAATAWASEPINPKLTTTSIFIGMHSIVAEVAKTDQQRGLGLMNRTSMAEHEGMIFVFDQPGTQCFWMKNTLIPLTAAFITDDGHITNLADMQPKSLNDHCSSQPVRYVLEVNQGWFARKKLDPAHLRLRGPLFDKP